MANGISGIVIFDPESGQTITVPQPRPRPRP